MSVQHASVLQLNQLVPCWGPKALQEQHLRCPPHTAVQCMCECQTAHESLAVVGHNIPLKDHTRQQANLCVSRKAPAGALGMERVPNTVEERKATGRQAARHHHEMSTHTVRDTLILTYRVES